MKTQLNPSALYWATFNRFELRIPGEAVQDIFRSGPADSAVEYWVGRIDWEAKNLRGIPQCTPDAIRAELEEYGAWDAEELADDEENRRRILWIAACNIGDEDEPDCSEPLVPSGETGPFAILGI